MTITRTRIRCRERACPWPFDEEFHEVPWCRGIKEHECFGGVTHQHHPKRSQGGKEIVALLCAGAHDVIDNGSRLSNDVIERDGRRIYRILHEKRGILYERDIGASSAAVEVSDSDENGAGASAVAPGPSTGERVGRDSRGATRARDLPAAVTPPDSLACWTLEELKAEARDSFEPFALQDEYDGANTTDLVLAWLDTLKEQA